MTQEGPTAPEQDWVRLGHAVQRRREVLGVTQEEVAAAKGPSVATLRNIENAQGDSYRSRTLYALDAALGWHQGTSIAIANGQHLVYYDNVDDMIEQAVSTVTHADRERYNVLVSSSDQRATAARQQHSTEPTTSELVSKASYNPPDRDPYQHTESSLHNLESEQRLDEDHALMRLGIDGIKRAIIRADIDFLLELRAIVTTTLIIRASDLSARIEDLKTRSAEATKEAAMYAERQFAAHAAFKRLHDELGADDEQTVTARIAAEHAQKEHLRATEQSHYLMRELGKAEKQASVLKEFN